MGFLDSLLRRAPGLLAQGAAGKRQGQDIRRDRDIEDRQIKDRQEQMAFNRFIQTEALKPKPLPPSWDRITDRTTGKVTYYDRNSRQTIDEPGLSEGVEPPKPVVPPAPRNIDPLSAEGIKARQGLATHEASLRPKPKGPAVPKPRAPTDSQVKTGALYASGLQGYNTLEGLLQSGKGVPSFMGQQLAKVGMGAGNVLTDQEFRRMRQAALMLSDAWLRFTSGAAVPETEVERFAMSFVPQAGDDEQTLAQKTDARKTIIDAMKKAAGSTVQDPLVPDAEAAPPSLPTSPTGSKSLADQWEALVAGGMSPAEATAQLNRRKP